MELTDSNYNNIIENTDKYIFIIKSKRKPPLL